MHEQTFAILDRWSRAVVWSGTAKSYRAALMAAIEAKVNLSDANLSDANLSDARPPGRARAGRRAGDGDRAGEAVAPMSLPADPCPHLWTPPCACPPGPFHEPRCAWFNAGIDPADYGPREDEEPFPPDCPCPFMIAGCHMPWCPEYRLRDEVRELDCPAEHGPRGDEYDWCVPDGPEDPDRSWAHRDSGE
jgi:hypothetical protein